MAKAVAEPWQQLRINLETSDPTPLALAGLNPILGFRVQGLGVQGLGFLGLG